jgi:subtilisin family serine protease
MAKVNGAFRRMDGRAHLTGRLDMRSAALRIGLVLALGAILSAGFGTRATASAAGYTDLKQLQSQAAIAPAYNFQTVPPTAGKDITVAIIAEGIDSAMKDSLGERVYMESVLGQDSNPFLEANGTGGRVGIGLAGLIGALAPQARIISIKALDSSGSGSFADIKNGIKRATELKAKIIILSCSSHDKDDDVAETVRTSLDQGVLIISPAGNSREYGPQFPGSLDGVISIGSSDIHSKVSSFSNYGGKIIFAPGEAITVIHSGKSESESGTCYAAGIAGGIFAVLWSQNPGLTRQQLVSFVVDSAANIEDPNGGQARRIDAEAALMAIKKSR